MDFISVCLLSHAKNSVLHQRKNVLSYVASKELYYCVNFINKQNRVLSFFSLSFTIENMTESKVKSTPLGEKDRLFLLDLIQANDANLFSMDTKVDAMKRKIQAWKKVKFLLEFRFKCI